MDHKEGESWGKSMPLTELSQSWSLSDQALNVANLQQRERNWEDSLLFDYGAKVFNQASGGDLSTLAGCSSDQKREMLQDSKGQDWDPRAMLNNLSFLEQKIRQLQELVHVIVGRSRGADELVIQQQQLITADITSIIIQLISTAGSLLPSVRNGGLLEADPWSNGLAFPPTTGSAAASLLLPQSNGVPVQQQNNCDVNPLVQLDQTGNCDALAHELKDDDDPIDEEHLPPGSYEILQLEKEEILAPHTHFCTICGKGFKRDANLRMHMRGHGDEYKTPAALAKPYKDSDESEPVLLKRYSCPYLGCKRNKDHKKFQALKTILCVKNHYKRTHCDKTYTCSRCNTKKFSVLADLKTHEKHCGRDKWLCSCGTTFSRKDKLFGHIALFQGHTPAIPTAVENAESSNLNKLGGSMPFSFASDNNSIQGIMDIKGNMDDTYFSLMGFDSCNSIQGLQEFSQSAFDDSGTSFPFLMSGTKNGLQSPTAADDDS